MLIVQTIAGCLVLIVGLTLWRLIYLTGKTLPDCNDDFIFF